LCRYYSMGFRGWPADPAVKVVVLTGVGRAFCAGGDVTSMAEGGERRSAADATAHLRSRMEVSRILKPTIAMINGPVAGAGFASLWLAIWPWRALRREIGSRFC